MADLSIKYKNSEIASLSATGTKVLTTTGQYCDGNIIVEYTRPNTATTATTIMPSAATQTVAPGAEYVGFSQVEVAGDSALIQDNIKAGTSIFGVTGTFTMAGTATASNILSGKIAYSRGSEITGTMANRGTLSWTATTTSTMYLGSGGYYSSIIAVASTTTTTITPSSTTQTVVGANGAFLKSVTVEAVTTTSPSFASFNLTISDNRTKPQLSSTTPIILYKYDLTSNNYVYVFMSQIIPSGSDNTYTWSDVPVPKHGSSPGTSYKNPWIGVLVNWGITDKDFDISSTSNCYATKYQHSNGEWVLLVAPTADGVNASVTLSDPTGPTITTGTLSLTINGNGLINYVYYPAIENGELVLKTLTASFGTQYEIPMVTTGSGWHGGGQYFFVDTNGAGTTFTKTSGTNASVYATNNIRSGTCVVQAYGGLATLVINVTA